MNLAVLQLVAALLVSIAMALSLAHALEFPGKLRLPQRDYLAVQQIYYPGFTWGGGIGEFLGVIATGVLLALTPSGSADFWLSLLALLCLIGMQAVYWLVTHPVNRVWVKKLKLGRGGERFFATGHENPSDPESADWTALRNRWEYSHVARAALALTAFVALLVAGSSLT